MVVALVLGVPPHRLERLHQDGQEKVDQDKTEADTEEAKQKGPGDLSRTVSGLVIKFTCKKSNSLIADLQMMPLLIGITYFLL